MTLLREIQSALIAEKSDIGPILFKLKLLASKLGVSALDEWVKFEMEGYPSGVDVPEYRKIGVSYSGTFFGPFGSAINNAPIPPFLIDKFAGKKWTAYEVRQSVASIDDLISHASQGVLAIQASDLMLLLQGKVYEGYACNAVNGQISKASLVEIQNAVRSRVLELTIQFEKNIPNSADITVEQMAGEKEKLAAQAVTGNVHQIIYGNYTSINNSGDNASINVSVKMGDIDSFRENLTQAGISASDAKELSDIVQNENPGEKTKPFGKKAQGWILKNINKALNGTWKIGLAVATRVLEEAAKRYYGLN